MNEIWGRCKVLRGENFRGKAFGLFDGSFGPCYYIFISLTFTSFLIRVKFVAYLALAFVAPKGVDTFVLTPMLRGIGALVILWKKCVFIHTFSTKTRPRKGFHANQSRTVVIICGFLEGDEFKFHSCHPLYVTYAFKNDALLQSDLYYSFKNVEIIVGELLLFKKIIPCGNSSMVPALPL